MFENDGFCDVALIGHTRDSAPDQHFTLQREALEQAGCDRIYTDEIGGARFNRSGLTDGRGYARPGDTLVIRKLVRLGRPHRVGIARDLEIREIHLRSITDQIDTTTAAERRFFHAMAALVSIERDLIVERAHVGPAVIVQSAIVIADQELCTNTLRCPLSMRGSSHLDQRDEGYLSCNL